MTRGTPSEHALIQHTIEAMSNARVPIRVRIAAGVEVVCTLVPWAEYAHTRLGALESPYLEAIGFGMPVMPSTDRGWSDIADHLRVISDNQAELWVSRIVAFLKRLQAHGALARRPPALHIVRGGL